MTKKFITSVLAASVALALSACDEGGGNSNNPLQVERAQDLSLEFDLTDAVALVANEDIVQEERSVSGGLPTYRTIGGSASRMGVSLRSIAAREGDQSQASDVAGSNLMALTDEGVLEPALVTNFPLKVMYSVASPSGDKIYIALDPGWWSNQPAVDEDGNWIDFSRVIAQSNCALFEVDTTTNDYSCVSEGLFVQNMDDNYMKAISGNQKPIQFDGDGNLYFAGTEFSIQEDSWEYCYWDDSNGQDVCEVETHRWINQTGWQPRIYRKNVDEDTASAVTQDNEYIEFFSVLKSGELVYQSRNEQDWTALLKMLQGSSVIDLTDGTGWGVDFFTVDDRNAVIFGQADWSGNGANGLRFARPRLTFGVEKASLDTSLFGGDNANSGWGNPKPRRLLVSDNGRIYGVFEGGRDTFDANGNHTGWEQTLTVYQILPFDGVPKLELSLGNEDWWFWMERTPFQVSGDLLFYTDSVDVPFLGTADVITMVDLNTREHTQLLVPNNNTGTGRYEIYNWRLAGHELHFSGLKKDNNTVVTGVIDTELFDPDVDSSVYFEVNEVASASGAASSIQDIEVIRRVSTETDPEIEPTATYFQSMENLFSMSIDFSVSMNWQSAEDAIALTHDGGTEGSNSDGNIDVMKIWVNKTLHLIPDLDGLADSSSTTPLSAGEGYTLTLASGAEDRFGNATTTDDTAQITMRPDNGWYTNSAEQLIYAGRDDNQWGWASYDLTSQEITPTVPVDFQLIFDAKNFSWDGVEIVLYDVTNMSEKTLFRMGLSGWSYVDYENDTNGWDWANGETRQIFNGSWNTYRLNVYGANMTLEVKPSDADAAEFETVTMFTRDDLASRTATGTDYRLMFRVIQPIGMDNLMVNELNSSGVVQSNVMTEDFSAFNVIGSAFETDVTSTYTDLYQ
jgi:hypothetical protein